MNFSRNLFLGGTDSQDLRPFGSDVVLDGVDFDNESGDGSYYSDLVTELRSKTSSDTSKSYYLSADPMCSLSTLLLLDTSPLSQAELLLKMKAHW